MDYPVIFANKIASPAYNGAYYNGFRSTAGAVTISLNFLADGTYSIVRNAATSGNFTSPTTGIWTDTPGTSYEVYATVTGLTTGGSGYADGLAIDNWYPITTSAYVVRATAPSRPSYCVAQFQISVRKVGTTSPVVVTSITFEVEASNV